MDGGRPGVWERRFLPRLVDLTCGSPSVARWQARLEPLQRRMAGGCHLTGPVPALLTAAGFAITEQRQWYLRRSPRTLGWLTLATAVVERR